MAGDYFHRVAATFPTRLWVNNPTDEECRLALAAGALSCTSNPTYGSNLWKRDRATVQAIIDQLPGTGDAAADEVQQGIIARVAMQFLPVFERTRGAYGHVSIQGDPRRDTDVEHIVDEAMRYRAIAPNIIAKIPITKAGLAATERVLLAGMPVIATEVFAVSQAIATARMYRRVRDLLGPATPKLWLTHIAGIFDDHIGDAAKRRGAKVAPEILRQAGCIVARAQYRALSESGSLPDGLTLLGGGARGTHHFTEVVGGRFDVTLNWSTVAEIAAQDPPVVDRLHHRDDARAVAELAATFEEVRQALAPDGLSLEEFGEYGPVQRFRNNFIEGWDGLKAAIAERRGAQAGHASR